jgi:hypothetical protein
MESGLILSCFLESTSFIFISQETRSVTDWFVFKNRISAATCLPIRFLGTPTCHNIQYYTIYRVV